MRERAGTRDTKRDPELHRALRAPSDARLQRRSAALGILLLALHAASASAQMGWRSTQFLQDFHLAIPQDGDEFGRALAVGDFDADGFEDLAMGIPRHEATDGVRSGGVLIMYGGPLDGLYSQTSRNQLWTQRNDRRLSSAADGDEYGSALASGDFNGDGFYDLAIGMAGSALSGSENGGAVEILYGSSLGITGHGRHFLVSRRGELSPDDAFGALLGADDFNADGMDDLAVTSKSAIEVFFGSSWRLGHGETQFPPRSPFESPSTTPRSVVLSPQIGGAFHEIGGYPSDGIASVATGDLNGDGRADLTVGAPGALSSLGSVTAGLGAVEIFFGTRTGGFAQSQVIRPLFPYSTAIGEYFGIDGALPDRLPMFGYALSSGDFDGDGVDDLAVGVPGADVAGVNVAGSQCLVIDYDWRPFLCGDVGGVIVFTGAPGGVDETPMAVVTESSYSTRSNGHVVLSGSFDMDPEEDLVFAAYDALELAEPSSGVDTEIEPDGFYVVWSLAAGDFDGDGQDEIVAGFPRGSVQGHVIGFVRVYTLE